MGVVILLKSVVDFLLLMGTGRLCGVTVKLLPAVMGAVLGGVYAGCCLQPGFYFLGNFFWRLVSMAVISLTAYGISRKAIPKVLLFTALSLTLHIAVVGIGKGGFTGIVCAVFLCLVCSRGFYSRMQKHPLVPVELSYGEKNISITALRDTGNTLRDPITGQKVLVIGSDAARELTGLTQAQLQSPVESVGVLPGLRLIPYQSVGGCGFLLALPMKQVRIGSWQGSTLVAFSPVDLNRGGRFQALTGGGI